MSRHTQTHLCTLTHTWTHLGTLGHADTHLCTGDILGEVTKGLKGTGNDWGDDTVDWENWYEWEGLRGDKGTGRDWEGLGR